jgi:DUF1680 family protein
MLVIRQNTTAQWDTVLNTEFGGMNEVLYRIFAITKQKKYYELGNLFEKPCFVGPLAIRQEELTGLHANTHVPIVIGDAFRYELDSDMTFGTVAGFFWELITTTRSYVTGGNSNYEHWQLPFELSAELSGTNQETCVSIIFDEFSNVLSRCLIICSS